MPVASKPGAPRGVGKYAKMPVDNRRRCVSIMLDNGKTAHVSFRGNPSEEDVEALKEIAQSAWERLFEK